MGVRSDIIANPQPLDTIAPNGRIGLIALATDFNSEQDLRRMLPDGVELFTNRVLNANPVTMQNLRNMSGDISRAAAGILPEFDLDAMIYGCTSGTVANGADNITKLIQQSKPDVAVTNPVSAAIEAFEQFSARKISILTPYTRTVNNEMAEYFVERGFEILNIAGFGYDSDLEMTCIPPSAIVEAAIQTCEPEADLLFISCTAIRSSLVIDQIEQAIDKPVVSSNQALVWHCLKLIDYAHAVDGFGSLLREH